MLFPKLSKLNKKVLNYLDNLHQVLYRLFIAGFRFDEKKLPFFNIPSLEHFKVI